MNDTSGPLEIAPDTYWVGKRDAKNIFHSNPYLRVFRDASGKVGASLLIDPGSATDVAVVVSKVTQVLGGMSSLSAVFVNHQDPDVGSSTPQIVGRHSPHASVVCSEDTWRLIVHFGLSRDRLLATDRCAHGIELGTGHVIHPVPTPFCHERGAVMLYDPETRVLFTGDLFGGLTEKDANGLFADDSDWKGMRAFHQIYMPSNDALRRAMASVRALSPAPLFIAPQHGRVLTGPLLWEMVDRLEKLPVGLDILDDQDDESLEAWNTVLARVLATARELLGASVESHLADDRDLADTLAFEETGIRATALGRWTMERVLDVLLEHEAPPIANAIKMEAIAWCDTLGLPTPRVLLDEEVPTAGASLGAVRAPSSSSPSLSSLATAKHDSLRAVRAAAQ
jgi:glyoxylase-like metal-dependent hydrolase (beta-lactamase superfamily II)